MTRLRVESILALLFSALAVVTAIWPDWIEILGFEPDNGDGSAEWSIVALLGILALISAVLLGGIGAGCGLLELTCYDLNRSV